MRKAKQPNIQTSQIIMSKMRKDLSLSNMPVGSVAVLSKNEFDTIKREAMMVGREEMTKSSKYENNIKQQEMEREMVRREHMKKLYEEKHKDMVELNEFELEEIENRDRLRRVKQQHEINQLDEVKYMDQMVSED